MRAEGATARRAWAALDLLVVALLLLLLVRAARASVEAAVFPYDLLQAVECSAVVEGTRLRAGLPNYVDPRTTLPFATQVYFPGYPGLLGAILSVWPEPVLVPRLVGTTAYVLLAAAVHLSARRAGAGRAGALLGAAFAIALHAPGLPLANRVGRGPYFLLVAGTVLAVQVALATRRRSWVAASAVLAAGATWFHQTGLLLVVWIGATLLPLGRSTALGAGLLALAAVGIPVGVMDAASGGWFTFHTMRSMRGQPLHLSGWLDTIRYLVAVQPVLLGLLAWAARRALRGDARLRPFALFALLFLPSEIFTSGMVGAGPQHVHILIPAAAVAMAVWWTERPRGGLLRLAPAAALVLALYLPGWRILRPTASDARNGDRIAALVRAADGPVLTDRHLGLVLREGREAEADMARLWEIWRYAGMPPRALEERIRARRYPLILSSRIYETDRIRAAVDEAYVAVDRIVSSDEYWYDFHVLVPRVTPEKTTPP